MQSQKRDQKEPDINSMKRVQGCYHLLSSVLIFMTPEAKQAFSKFLL